MQQVHELLKSSLSSQIRWYAMPHKLGSLRFALPSLV